MPVGLVSPLPTNCERTNTTTHTTTHTTTVPSSPAFDVLRLLKTTPTSKIRLVLPRATFTPVVLKTSNTSASNSVLNELRILQKLSHPAVIKPLNAPLRYGDDGINDGKLNAPIECHLFLPYLQPLPAQSTKVRHRTPGRVLSHSILTLDRPFNYFPLPPFPPSASPLHVNPRSLIPRPLSRLRPRGRQAHEHPRILPGDQPEEG